MNNLEIKFTKTKCELCKQEVNSIDLDQIKITIESKLYTYWACDDCRKELIND